MSDEVEEICTFCDEPRPAVEFEDGLRCVHCAREQDELCGVMSASKYSFMRTWFCSLRPNHAGPHLAYPNHKEPASMAEVCWLGPWEDGRPYPSLEEFAAAHGLEVS